MQQCCIRKADLLLLGTRVCCHWHWRSRKSKYKKKWKVKYSQWHLNHFLTPLKSGQIVCNQHCRADRGFLLMPSSLFLLHLSHGCVPEEVLDELMCDCGHTFLAAPQLIDHFNSRSLKYGAQKTVACLNLFQVSFEMDQSALWKCHTFTSCPLVWDTGEFLVLLLFDRTSLTTLSAVYQ